MRAHTSCIFPKHDFWPFVDGVAAMISKLKKACCCLKWEEVVWWSVGFYLSNLIFWITLGVPRRSALFVGHATTSRTPGCADHICNQSIDCTASCVLAENMLLLLHSLCWSILVLPMGKNCCMLNTHRVTTLQTFGIKNLFIYLLKEKISLVPGSF